MQLFPFRPHLHAQLRIQVGESLKAPNSLVACVRATSAMAPFPFLSSVRTILLEGRGLDKRAAESTGPRAGETSAHARDGPRARGRPSA